MNLVQHSPDIQATFQKHVQAMSDCPINGRRIRNLQYAKHRFDSLSKPLGRFILLFGAVWATACELLVTRAGRKPAQRAKAFLNEITVEATVQLAMLADAGHEALVVTRFHDTEAYDAAEISSCLSAFVHKIDLLFLQRGCKETGFTQHALKMLSHPHVAHVTSTEMKVLGGPDEITEEIVTRCIQRMCNWVHLAIRSIRAEFPSYELIQMFSIFNLQEVPVKAKHAPMPRNLTEAAERFALVFHIDAEAFKQQYEAALTYAWRMFTSQTESTGSVHAWVASIKKMQHRKLRDLYPVHALLPVLQRYIAFCGCTTSGIEQCFAVLRAQLGEHRSTMNDRSELAELKIKVDMCPSSTERVIKKAQEIWKQVYGSSRSSSTVPRFSSSQARKRKTQERPTIMILASTKDVSPCNNQVTTVQNVINIQTPALHVHLD